jgi:hypothetical protein
MSTPGFEKDDALCQWDSLPAEIWTQILLDSGVPPCMFHVLVHTCKLFEAIVPCPRSYWEMLAFARPILKAGDDDKDHPPDCDGPTHAFLCFYYNVAAQFLRHAYLDCLGWWKKRWPIDVGRLEFLFDESKWRDLLEHVFISTPVYELDSLFDHFRLPEDRQIEAIRIALSSGSLGLLKWIVRRYGVEAINIRSGPRSQFCVNQAKMRDLLAACNPAMLIWVAESDDEEAAHMREAAMIVKGEPNSFLAYAAVSAGALDVLRNNAQKRDRALLLSRALSKADQPCLQWVLNEFRPNMHPADNCQPVWRWRNLGTFRCLRAYQWSILLVNTQLGVTMDLDIVAQNFMFCPDLPLMKALLDDHHYPTCLAQPPCTQYAVKLLRWKLRDFVDIDVDSVFNCSEMLIQRGLLAPGIYKLFPWLALAAIRKGNWRVFFGSIELIRRRQGDYGFRIHSARLHKYFGDGLRIHPVNESDLFGKYATRIRLDEHDVCLSVLFLAASVACGRYDMAKHVTDVFGFQCDPPALCLLAGSVTHMLDGCIFPPPGLVEDGIALLLPMLLGYGKIFLLWCHHELARCGHCHLALKVRHQYLLYMPDTIQ